MISGVEIDVPGLDEYGPWEHGFEPRPLPDNPAAPRDSQDMPGGTDAQADPGADNGPKEGR